MNIFDIVIILLLLLSAANGYRRGILKEGVMLGGTFIIYIISFLMKGKIGIMLCKMMPFFEFDGVKAYNILIYQIVAFTIIAGILFSIFGIILKLTGILQKVVDLSIILTLPSKILGAVAGLIEGYIVIFGLLIILSVPLKTNDLFINSKLSNTIITSSPILTNSLGNLDNIIVDIQKISSETDKNKLNSELLKMYTEYNIISDEDLKDIINAGKLK